MYVLGGNSDYIEVLNIKDPYNNGWKLLNVTLDAIPGASIDYSRAEYVSSVSYGRFISYCWL